MQYFMSNVFDVNQSSAEVITHVQLQTPACDNIASKLYKANKKKQDSQHRPVSRHEK